MAGRLFALQARAVGGHDRIERSAPARLCAVAVGGDAHAGSIQLFALQYAGRRLSGASRLVCGRAGAAANWHTTITGPRHNCWRIRREASPPASCRRIPLFNAITTG